MDLGKIVKKAVEAQNMLAWQFNTIGVSDGITMGSDGMQLALTLTLCQVPFSLHLWSCTDSNLPTSQACVILSSPAN